MPNREPVVLQQDQISLRLIGPQSIVWPGAPVSLQQHTLLSRSDLVARPLPAANLPSSPDFASGSWTLRLGDAGEAQVTFPNATASDGIPWRQRFDPTGHLMFLEVRYNGVLDYVGVVDQVTPSQQSVTVHSFDAWWLLKKAYTRDWIVTQAPRDVIEHGTRVWQPLTVDDFAYQGSPIPGSQWNTSTTVNASGLSGAGANDTSWNPMGGVSTVSWTNPNNISTGSSPASASTSTVLSSGQQIGTYGLQATGFGFAIPSTATIVGFEVGVDNNYSVSTSGGWSTGSSPPQLVVGGAVTNYKATSGQSSGSAPFTSTTRGWSYNGGPTDNYKGAAGTLTPAQVNASNFGAEIAGAMGIYSTGTITLNAYRMSIEIWYTTPGSSVVSVRSTGGLSMSVTNTSGAEITSNPVPCTSTIWTTEAAVLQTPASGVEFAHIIQENGLTLAQIGLANGIASLYWNDSAQWQFIAQVTPASSATWDLRMESDGEWVSGFVNGQLIGCFRRPLSTPTSLTTVMNAYSLGTVAGTVVVSSVITEALVPLLMQSSSGGTHGPAGIAGTGADGGGGSVAWSTPNSITTPAGSASIGAINPNSNGNYLYATNYGFNIPANATILGVAARIPKSYGTVGFATVADNAVKLLVGGALTGTSQASASLWPGGTTPGQSVYGGLHNLWGTTLTPAQVNASNFGVAIQPKNTNGTFAASTWVYYPVVMVVYYTVPGTDSGDYVLPGTASTYPWGGLHGRYFNDADLQNDPQYLLKVLNPTRTQAYGGSAPTEYFNRQDATINNASSSTPSWAPTPGVAVISGAQSYFSVRWFGAIYLKPSQGSYSFAFASDDAIRVWVGKTGWGDQIIDGWVEESTTTYTATVTASSLAGSPGYGGGTVARDGWYPIVIEYQQGSTQATAQFYFTPPAGYTDPGGTALAGGTQVIVPATSLSPLGCVDQRYQGISHFDLVQQTAQAFGYQASVEPQPLESGLFPGVLAPRIREGHDTDLELTPDVGPRQDGEGLLNYSSTIDASDFASSMQGNGAGFQSGTTGQLQQMVYDPATMLDSLFDAQGWQDFSDASFPSLLQGLLNAQLGLSLEPWQMLSADPHGRPRRAFTWPLPGTIQNMRWRPGDGLRINAPLIEVQDSSPRQMLVVTRNITPHGFTGTQATFANRPKNPAHAVKRQLYAATRQQRNYQRQLVTLQSDISAFILAAALASGASSAYFGVALLPNDKVVRAAVRLAFNSGTAGLAINGTDVTTALGGPWIGAPIVIDITGYAVTNPTTVNDGRLYAQVINKGGASASLQPQMLVDVLR